MGWLGSTREGGLHGLRAIGFPARWGFGSQTLARPYYSNVRVPRRVVWCWEFGGSGVANDHPQNPGLVPPPHPSTYLISGSFHQSFNFLVILPLQYFFAIGLDVVFRVSRCPPAVLRSDPKERYSAGVGGVWGSHNGTGLSPSLALRSSKVPLWSTHGPTPCTAHRF